MSFMGEMLELIRSFDQGPEAHWKARIKLIAAMRVELIRLRMASPVETRTMRDLARLIAEFEAS